MRVVRRAGRFTKDLRLAQRRGNDISKLEAVLDMLLAGKPLPPARQDHPLGGERRGYRECHIEPDWLLIYRVTRDEVELARVGTHSDLFK